MSNNIYNMSSRQMNNQTIRDLINNYNSNMQIFNLNMMDYNRNINSLISLLETNSILTRPFTPRTRPIASPNFRTSNLRRNLFNDDNFYANILLSLSNQLQNQRRGLTAIEIQNYTRTIQYTNDLPNNICHITHEEFIENEDICQIVHCGHYFKPTAIETWLRSNSTCPSCRHNLLSIETIRNNDNTINENNDATNDEADDENNDDVVETTNDENNTTDNFLNNSVLDFIRNTIPTDASLNIDPSFNLHYSFELPMVYYPPNNV